MPKKHGLAHKLKKIFNPRWLGLDFAKLTAGPSFPLVFRTLRYYEEPGMKRPRPRGRAIIVSNHTCFWDPVIIVSEFFTRRVRFLISKGLHDSHRIMALLLDLAGGIVVDKDNFNFSCIQEMVSVLEDNGIVGIFPEGKISETGELLPFKEGVIMIALRTGAPILPLVISGDEKLRRRKVVMYGKPIALASLLPEGEKPSLANIQQMAGRLHDKMMALQQQLDGLENARLAKKAARRMGGKPARATTVEEQAH